MSRFGIAFKVRGRIGVLSLTVGEATHEVAQMAPANLLSIARALVAHGVETDDRDLIAETEAAWEEALTRGRQGTPLLDRAAMRTRAFDHGAWLLLGLGALAFYLNPFGIGLGESRDAVPALLAVPVVGAVCGFVSGSRASLAHLAPLNLLAAPAFFFYDPGEVTFVMAALSALVGASTATGVELTTVRLAVQQATAKHLPVDGRSNLTGGAASLTYTPRPGLVELVTDEAPLAGPDDGARWELRSPFTKGCNTLTLGHYVVRPRLDGPAAVAAFVADKDRAHSRLAGSRVTHTTRVVDGRTGYVWKHGSPRGYWYFAAWFPHPAHSVRVECIARRQASRFRRLCAEAMGSLEFR